MSGLVVIGLFGIAAVVAYFLISKKSGAVGGAGPAISATPADPTQQPPYDSSRPNS